MNISQDNKDINGKENEDSLSGIKYLLIENKILLDCSFLETELGLRNGRDKIQGIILNPKELSLHVEFRGIQLQFP